MRVYGTVNGVPYHSNTMPLAGGRLYLGVHKATREAAKVAIGETLDVEVTRDTSPRELALPPTLEDAFRAEPLLGERFASLSFSRRRDLATPIADAKRPETRVRRLEEALRRLRESPPPVAGRTGTRMSDAPDRPGGRR